MNQRWPDIRALRRAYERGENITQLLRSTELGFTSNSIEAIEIAYDLQAGSYARRSLQAPDELRCRAEEASYLLRPHIRSGDRVLDCGTGELTTLSALSHHLPLDISLMAFDISLSRIRVGRRFARRAMQPDLFKTMQDFVAEMGRIPLPEKSVDIVLTYHALEPNHGREEALLRELLRVTRRRLILFEPSWEQNSRQGRERMARLGYIRELPHHIASVGGRLLSTHLLSEVSNKLNPTCCYIVAPTVDDARQAVEDNVVFICPISGYPLDHRLGYWWSACGGWAFPEIEQVPCLRERYAILMTLD